MKQYLLAFIFILYGSIALAQSAAQCTRSLDEAEQAFEQGRLLYILDRVANRVFYNCLDNGGFSKEEEIRARKLLVKAYLFSDNEREAEDRLVDLLRTDKEHQLTQEDPAELYFLYSKFKTEPILRVAARFGGNKSFVNLLQEFNTSQITKTYNPGVGSGINIWSEILVEKYLGAGFEVAGGPQIRFITYDVEGAIIQDNLTYTVSNRNGTLRLPIIFRYNFGYDSEDADGRRRTFTPYLFFGASYDFVIQARYEDTSRSGGTAVSLDDGSSDLLEFNQVARNNASLLGGVGVKMRVGRARVDFFTIELRYDNSLFNYIDPANRWDNQTLNFDIGHVEDDLTINTISFSVGYTRSFYIPRKRKQYR